MATDTIDAEFTVDSAQALVPLKSEEQDAGPLAALNKSEIDMQISTAKRYPRSIAQFKRDVMEMATIDEETAGGMFYRLPRGGKKIEGPSIRMAEVVSSAWGNLRFGARLVAIEERFVVAQGFCFDLQKNTAASIEVSRRITDKDGVRFGDDMIQVTGGAAKSIALREAIFKVVPRMMFADALERAKLVSVGKAGSMEQNRQKLFKWFASAGATEKQVLTFLGHKGLDDVSLDDLVTLKGISNAVMEGEIELATALNLSKQPGGKISRSSLNDKLAPKDKQPSDEHQDSDTVTINVAALQDELAACKKPSDVKGVQQKWYLAHPGLANEAAITEWCEHRLESF